MRNLLVAAVVLGVGGYFGAKFYVQYKTAKDLDAVLTQARPMVDIQYENVVATMGGELRVEGVTLHVPQFDDEITIESVGLQTPGFLFLLGFDQRKVEMPERLGVSLSGMRMRADSDFMRALDNDPKTVARRAALTPADQCATSYGFSSAMLQQLGYHDVVMDFSMEFRRQGSRVVMGFGADVENMYDIDIELTLDGIADPTELARGARPLLVGARIDYVDQSLNNRIMKYCMEQEVTAEDVIAAQLREVHQLARDTGMELDAMIIQPYTDFLLGKQRFTLIAQPINPVDLTQLSLYKPSDVPNLLNLTAEAG
ncbi:MAG TPA: hypothetical protein VM692_00870 [Gammaproteobacteria bacterium]|nr:hypothetical protein [Gammaproteobacteria bacterium]